MRQRIQVLVVLVLILSALGLLALGVQTVRETSFRERCRNNLRQLAPCLQTYHDVRGFYPTATVSDRSIPTTLPPERRLSWQVLLAPFYVGGVALVVDETRAWDDAKNRDPVFRIRDTHGNYREEPVGTLPFLQCPANPALAGSGDTGLTHYVGVAGVGREAASQSAGSPGIGLFGYHRQTRKEDIKDGAATTVGILEATYQNGPWTAGGHSTVRGLDPNDQSYLGSTGPFGGNHERSLFGRLQRSGAFAVFVDGSVRYLPSATNPAVLEALATIAGGERSSLPVTE